MKRFSLLALALLSSSLFILAKDPPAEVLTDKPARYVRVFIPGNATLTLAEVEVLSGGKNIAPSGKAKQNATASGGDAARAIDGNKNPTYNAGGQTHTPVDGKDPWWELDLAIAQKIDSVGIWNRGESFAGRMNGFYLELLDEDRKVTFRRGPNGGQDGSIHFEIKPKGKVVALTHEGKSAKVAKYVDSWKANAKKEPAKVTARPRVEVPADYRDPSFAFQEGDTVSLIGNALGDRMQHDGWFETVLQSGLRGKKVSFRNMAFHGDQVGKYPRNKGFTPMDAYLQHVGADVIFCMFGYNESFENKADDYKKRLIDLVKELRGIQPNGKTFPRIVLFSPIAHEDLEDRNLPDGRANNERLAAYTVATSAAAKEAGVTFVDLFTRSQALYAASDAPLTINGIHLNEEGNRQIAEVIGKALLGKEVAANDALEPLREAVLDKNWHWYNRYRASDGNDIWGGRSTLKFVDGQTNAEVLQHELIMLDVMTANRDPKVWARATGGDHDVIDENVPPPVPVISNVGGGSKSSNASKEGDTNYISGEEGLEKITVPEGFEVNLFADEKMFPELANPVQMQVDGKGRIWAAAWHTYPKWEPLKEMRDALIIFEDTDKDGKADSCKEFARVHNPLGFEFWNGGVLVTTQPELLFLKDTDGDDVADVRYVIMGGFGSADTHHTANNLIYGPDGGIYWQSGVFLQHNHETPWAAPLNTGSSAMFRFDPRRHTIAVVAGNSPNPHGISFDDWGYLYATDGTGGRAYQVRPEGTGFKMHALLNKEVRPVPANAVVASANFPEEMQGNFLICNSIGFLGIKQYKLHRDGYKKEEKGKVIEYKTGEVWGTPEPEMLVSTDKNFRPTDAVFGEDGALYVSDWSNVIIGHMQHNIRDPNRDKQHGRIYRVVHKDRPLQKPVAIAGQPVAALLDNLTHPVDGVRHRTRVELSGRTQKEVIPALREWTAQWDPRNPEHAHHMIEALWLHQAFNVRNQKLLGALLKSPVEHARIAATTVQHHWFNADPVKGGGTQLTETDDLHGEKLPSGIIKDGPNLTEIQVNTIIEKMKYDVTELEVKAGKKIKLTFTNPDFMPHNLVIVKPGTADKVAAAALTLGAKSFELGFVPTTDDVLAKTDLIDNGKEYILEFTAPDKAGDYQYVCTFPGHSILMRGVLKVR